MASTCQHIPNPRRRRRRGSGEDCIGADLTRCCAGSRAGRALRRFPCVRCTGQFDAVAEIGGDELGVARLLLRGHGSGAKLLRKQPNAVKIVRPPRNFRAQSQRGETGSNAGVVEARRKNSCEMAATEGRFRTGGNRYFPGSGVLSFRQPAFSKTRPLRACGVGKQTTQVDITHIVANSD